MAEPTFDHERLDVYRLSIDYVAFSYRIAKSLGGANRQARDQWLRAAQSIPLNMAHPTDGCAGSISKGIGPSGSKGVLRHTAGSDAGSGIRQAVHP